MKGYVVLGGIHFRQHRFGGTVESHITGNKQGDVAVLGMLIEICEDLGRHVLRQHGFARSLRDLQHAVGTDHEVGILDRFRSCGCETGSRTHSCAYD